MAHLSLFLELLLDFPDFLRQHFVVLLERSCRVVHLHLYTLRRVRAIRTAVRVRTNVWSGEVQDQVVGRICLKIAKVVKIQQDPPTP